MLNRLLINMFFFARNGCFKNWKQDLWSNRRLEVRHCHEFDIASVEISTLTACNRSAGIVRVMAVTLQ